MRLLTVDDDPAILDLLDVALSVNGYSDVTACGSGLEAISLVAESRESFGAFLIDIQMPGMDGVELCRRLRALPVYRRTPILMVTAMSDKRYVNQAFAAGANDFINKPFDVLELGVRLRNTLELTGARQKIEAIDLPEPFDEDTFVSDDLVDELTLENYLQQLSRCGAEHSLVAFRISNARTLKARMSQPGYEAMLRSFVSSFRNLMEGETFFIAYLGDGTFVSINQASHNRFDTFMRGSLQDSLNMQEWRESDAPKAALAMGDVIRCRKFRAVDGKQAIRHAVSTAEEATGALAPKVLTAEMLNAAG